MRKTERDVRWGAAAVLGILLLGVIGCTKVLEQQHQVGPAGQGDGAQAAVASDGFLTDFPTEPPGEGSAAVDAAPASGETAVDAQAEIEPTLRVHEIQLAQRDGREALLVILSQPPARVRSFGLSTPNRVVLDLEGPLAVGTSTQVHPVAAGGVARVRVGAHEGQLRVVADLRGALPDVSTEQDGRIVVALLGATEPGADNRIVYHAPGVTRAAVAAAPEASDRAVLAAEPEPAAAVDAPSAPVDVAVDAPPRTVEEAAAPVVVAEAPPAENLAGDAGGVVPRPQPRPEPAAAPVASNLVLDDPVVEEPTTYALPVQAKSKRARDSRSRVASVPGGMIEALPPKEPREYTGQRISLDFKDADIQNVLRILADVSGLNIITTEEVQGKLTMRLVDVPWDQAFDAILRAKNLDSVRDGNIIRVSTVEQLKKERDAQRAADEAQKQVEPLEVKYLKVNYAKADEKLVKKIQEVITDRGSATWDERTNTIVVRDIARGVIDAEELVRQFDTQTPQIQIESNIVEADESFVRDMGIQWGYSYKAGPGTGNSTGVNFPGKVNSGGVLAGAPNSPAGAIPFIADFPAAVSPGLGSAYDVLLGSLDGSQTLAARLTALEREGKVKIISRPRVVTLNNLPATIESLRILRVRLPSTGTVISTGAGGVAGGSQAATEQIKTGITLTVTPQVSSDGFIFLDVFAKSSTTAPSSIAEAGITIPDEVSRQAESHVLIRDGETFVLGGVFQNELRREERGIPYLRTIPVLGWAFKDHSDNDHRQELMVFVTPKIVQGRGTEDLAKLPSAESLWQNRPHP